MKKLGIFFYIWTVLVLCSGCGSGPLRGADETHRPAASVRSSRPVKLKSTKRALPQTLKKQSGRPAGRKTAGNAQLTGFAKLQKEYGLVSLPTYDGSGQATHPKILYFPRGWNGYKYWMSFTPYPKGNDDYENPSILVSNDMTKWIVPEGLKNPVSEVPGDVRFGGHYSDPHLVVRGNVMELWYRYDWGDILTRRTDYSRDYYYRRISTDGIHWTDPSLMQQSTSGILSLVVLYENGRYQFWYTDYSHKLMHAQSTDGSEWTNVAVCDIPLPENYAPWHQDIVRYGGEYYLLQTAINLKHYSFKLFLSHSSDGIHFSGGIPFYPADSPVILTRAWLYRSTLFVENNRFRMMIPIRFPDGRWFMMKAELPISEFSDPSGSRKAIVLSSPSEKKTIRAL